MALYLKNVKSDKCYENLMSTGWREWNFQTVLKYKKIIDKKF